MYSVPLHQSQDVYNTKLIDYGNGKYKLVSYSKLFSRLKRGLELPEEFSKLPINPFTQIKASSGVIRKDNLYRSSKLLHDLVDSNNHLLKSFITLTFAENITSLSHANKCFNTWRRSIARVFPDFLYIAVPEFQKRGAVHYHILCNIPTKSDIIPERVPLRLKGASRPLNYYDIKYWGHGYSSAICLVEGVDSNFNPTAYLAKYFWKDIDNRLFGRNKVLRSTNCLLPTETLLIKGTPEYEDTINYLNGLNQISESRSVSLEHGFLETTFKTFIC